MNSAPDAAWLRMQLTNPLHLANDISYRLRTFGFRIDSSTSALINAACAHGAEYRSLQELAEVTCLNYDRLRRALRRTNLCTPARLYQVLRLLLACVELQRNAHGRVADVCTLYHFYDEAALRARIRELFGASPSAVRGWVGWEPLLYIALHRSGIRLCHRLPGAW
jgi:AraC-like DNA-binding protein